MKIHGIMIITAATEMIYGEAIGESSLSQSLKSASVESGIVSDDVNCADIMSHSEKQ